LAHAAISHGHQVAIHALGPTEQNFQGEVDELSKVGVIIDAPAAKIGKLRRIFRMRQLLHSFQPDIAFAHSVIPAFYLRGSTLLPPSCPCVSVLHAPGKLNYGEGSSVERMLTHRTAAIIAVDPGALTWYEKTIKPHHRCLTIPNGIDVDAISSARPQRNSTRHMLGIADSAPCIIQVGRIDPVKRQVETIAMCDIIHKRWPNLQLLLVGPDDSPEYLAEIRSAIQGKEFSIRLLGGRKDIPALLAAADLIVMPSVYEAHSIAMLEALASGRPVVGSDIASFQSFIDQPGVLLVNPMDQNQYAKASEALLVQGLGNTFSRNLNEFSIEHTYQAYDRLAHELASPC
jgi:glycosyltransferase involved in cell wall biosynthesis